MGAETWFWATPLVVVVFLWTLNEFLNGRLKTVLSSALALGIFLLSGLAAAISGWKAGVAALLGSFILSNLMRPLALGLARRLVHYPDLGAGVYGSRELARVIDRSEQRDDDTPSELEDDRDSVRDRLVSSALRQPDVSALLQKLGAGPQDLEALYDRVEISSLPPELRQSALLNPILVEYFLANSDPAESYDGSYVRNLRGLDASLTLQLWASSNPSGPMP